MQRFAVVSKKDENSLKASSTIKSFLCNHNFNYDEETPELVLVIGGDGTFLTAVQRYIGIIDNVCFAAIHNGTLGFFADYRLSELDEFLEKVISEEPVIQEKKLIKATVGDKTYLAVNEFVVQSRQTKSIDVYIDGDKLENYHGTGLIISTQAGSTAYSRSVGGAVVAPNLEIMQICEFAGVHHIHYHSLANPLIVSGDSVIKLCCDFRRTHLIYDRWEDRIDGYDSITLQLSNKRMRIAHYKNVKWVKHLEQLF